MHSKRMRSSGTNSGWKDWLKNRICDRGHVEIPSGSMRLIRRYSVVTHQSWKMTPNYIQNIKQVDIPCDQSPVSGNLLLHALTDFWHYNGHHRRQSLQLTSFFRCMGSKVLSRFFGWWSWHSCVLLILLAHWRAPYPDDIGGNIMYINCSPW